MARVLAQALRIGIRKHMRAMAGDDLAYVTSQIARQARVVRRVQVTGANAVSVYFCFSY